MGPGQPQAVVLCLSPSCLHGAPPAPSHPSLGAGRAGGFPKSFFCLLETEHEKVHPATSNSKALAGASSFGAGQATPEQGVPNRQLHQPSHWGRLSAAKQMPICTIAYHFFFLEVSKQQIICTWRKPLLFLEKSGHGGTSTRGLSSIARPQC